jgi:hypothetical protein
MLMRFVKPLLAQPTVLKDWGVHAYRHYRLGMEIVILLISKHDHSKTQKSDFGTQLAENLKPYGIVSHSVWEELSITSDSFSGYQNV